MASDTISSVAARTTYLQHVGGTYLDQLRERDEWERKVRACGFDVDALLERAKQIADESIDATIATPRPALTDRQARGIAWCEALNGLNG